MRPAVGREDRRRGTRAASSCHTRSARAATRARPARNVEVEAVDRPHRVPAARVLDDEVADLEVGHHAPPNASAGSTVMARRKPARLASEPDDDRDDWQDQERDRRDLGRHREESVASTQRQQRRRASAGDQRETITACTAKPAQHRIAVPSPVALNTAKVAHPFERGEVDHRSDDQRGDDREQHGDEVDRLPCDTGCGRSMSSIASSWSTSLVAGGAARREVTRTPIDDDERLARRTTTACAPSVVRKHVGCARERRRVTVDDADDLQRAKNRARCRSPDVLVRSCSLTATSSAAFGARPFEDRGHAQGRRSVRRRR